MVIESTPHLYPAIQRNAQGIVLTDHFAFSLSLTCTKQLDDQKEIRLPLHTELFIPCSLRKSKVVHGIHGLEQNQGPNNGISYFDPLCYSSLPSNFLAVPVLYSAHQRSFVEQSIKTPASPLPGNPLPSFMPTGVLAGLGEIRPMHCQGS